MFNWLRRKEQPKSEEEIQQQQEKFEEGLTRTKRGFFASTRAMIAFHRRHLICLHAPFGHALTRDRSPGWPQYGKAR